jgi:hypothetical protein
MPRPGKAPFKRFHRVKMPVYRQASLGGISRLLGYPRKSNAYFRAHGSPFALAEAAANFLGSKPVMEGRSANLRLRES